MKTQSENVKKKKRMLLIGSVTAICLLAVGASVYFSAASRLQPKTKLPPVQPAPPVTQSVQPKNPSLPSAPPPAQTPQAKPEMPAEAQTDRENVDVLANQDTVERAAEFSLPMEGKPVQGYSNGEMLPSKTMGDWRTHNGVDFAGALGDPVKAINNGVVKAVYDDVLWGTVVEIDHGKGMLARYCGFGKGSTVSVGDKVKINDKVGNLGEIPIEKADGIHLHLEILQDGKPVDPMKAMEKA